MSMFNDEVLYIHIPKAGGTSCREYLKAHLPGAVDSLERGGPLPIDSTPLRHVPEYTGRPLDSWQQIVIPVRNPYAQVVSHWAYHRNRYALGGRHVHDRCAALAPTVPAWLMEAHSDFRVWYEIAIRRRNGSLGKVREHVNRWDFYEYWIANERGEVPSNVILVLCETLSKDFPEVLRPYCGGEMYPMPHARSSPHNGRPLDYLNGAALDAIHERFRWTFDQELYVRVQR